MFLTDNKKGFISKKTAGLILSGGLILILLTQILFYQPVSLGLAAMIIFISIVSFLYNPPLGILIILVIRTATDKIASGYSISFGRHISLNANALLGILMIGLTLFSFFYFKKKFNKPFYLVALLWVFYLAISFASIIWSIDKMQSVYEFFRILSIFSLFILGFLTVDLRKPYSNFKLILYTSIIPLSIAAYQFLTETGMGRIAGLKNRLYGTLTDPNSFAAFVLIIIIIVSFFIIQKEKFEISKNVRGYSFLFFLILILIATFSRGGWLGLLIFGLLLSIFKKPKFLIFIGIFLSLIIMLFEPVRDRLEDVYNPPITGSVYWRLEQWGSVYQLYKKQPLTGYGLGTETLVHEKEFGFYAGNPYTHNDLLKNALELGFFGALSYGLLLLATPLVLLFNYFKNSNKAAKNVLLFTFLIFIAETGFSMTSNIQRSTIIQWIIWFLVGSSLALCSKRKTSRKT